MTKRISLVLLSSLIMTSCFVYGASYNEWLEHKAELDAIRAESEKKVKDPNQFVNPESHTSQAPVTLNVIRSLDPVAISDACDHEKHKNWAKNVGVATAAVGVAAGGLHMHRARDRQGFLGDDHKGNAEFTAARAHIIDHQAHARYFVDSDHRQINAVESILLPTTKEVSYHGKRYIHNSVMVSVTGFLSYLFGFNALAAYTKANFDALVHPEMVLQLSESKIDDFVDHVKEVCLLDTVSPEVRAYTIEKMNSVTCSLESSLGYIRYTTGQDFDTMDNSLYLKLVNDVYPKLDVALQGDGAFDSKELEKTVVELKVEVEASFKKYLIN